VFTARLEGEAVQIVSSGLSDVGRVRTNNEDSFRIVEPLNLFILSDGMGGEAHGEVASAMAVDVINKFCESEKEDSGATVLDEAPANISSQTRRLKGAVAQANFQIFQASQKNPEQRGMGATITALWLKDTLLSIAHVGDSRAYLLRSGNLQQLTNDHSLVAEQVRRGLITPQQAEESEMQSVLLRALGAHPEVEIDTDEVEIIPRDVLLLCSDGLTRMVTEPEIAGALQAETVPSAAAERLISLANENGGVDNVTVIVVRFEDDANKGWFSWMRRGAAKKD
jgi:serine/threonine protein phosphatase PrpC